MKQNCCVLIPAYQPPEKFPEWKPEQGQPLPPIAGQCPHHGRDAAGSWPFSAFIAQLCGGGCAAGMVFDGRAAPAAARRKFCPHCRGHRWGAAGIHAGKLYSGKPAQPVRLPCGGRAGSYRAADTAKALRRGRQRRLLPH